MTCPFCGVETDVAHETQEGCIEALRSEILRVRDILQTVRTFEVPGMPDDSVEAAPPPEEGTSEPSF